MRGHFTVNQTLLAQFGNSIQRVERGLDALRNGRGVLVTDDENRENEGDLIYSATHLTVEQMALLIRECSGIVCICLPEEKIAALEIPMMMRSNNSRFETAFTVSIEAREGVTTGVSAQDRVTTIKTAIRDDCKPEDLVYPGHVFPLKARNGGVLERRGHTEATVDLMRLAGLPPYGVLCELTNPDGTMARMPEVINFGQKHDMPVLTIEDIAQYRKYLEQTRSIQRRKLPPPPRKEVRA
jgi:3,4-dihydroxy 2-butanone 4-phosphate synthase